MSCPYREALGKFSSRNDKCIFLGYALNSHAFRIFNEKTRTMMESTNVELDESLSAANSLDDDAGTVAVPTMAKPSLSDIASVKSEETS